MATSKKDFEAIARILKRTANTYCCDGADAVEEITEALADYFRTGNPAFDRERFLKACAADSPEVRARKRLEMATYANLNS